MKLCGLGLRIFIPAALGAVSVSSVGCSGFQSSLNPAGPQAERISDLFWLYCTVALAVYIVVMLFVLGTIVRRRSASDEPIVEPDAKQEARLVWIVSGSVALTVVILLVLLIADFTTGQALHSLSDSEPLKIRITARQWWWEVQYQDPTPSNMMTTANELHLPVGRVVQFELISPDVIHSFWIPNLHGKRDVIPGHPTTSVLRADVEGEYWGQCAEFCGYQHANMRLVATVEPEEKFQKWLESQRKPAPPPENDRQKRGQQVFLSTSCVLCHTVQGTTARATVGPDLTHLASRTRIAAGTLPNTRGHLGGWIVDPQRIKPGVRMPMNTFKPDDLHALLDYLESLK